MQQQPPTISPPAAGGPKKFEKKVVVKKAANIKGFEDAEFSEQAPSLGKPDSASKVISNQVKTSVNTNQSNSIGSELGQIPQKDTPAKTVASISKTSTLTAKSTISNGLAEDADSVPASPSRPGMTQELIEPVESKAVSETPVVHKPAAAPRPAPPARRPANAPPAPQPKLAAIPRPAAPVPAVLEAEPEEPQDVQQPEEHSLQAQSRDPVLQEALITRTQSAYVETAAPKLQTQKTRSTGAPAPTPQQPQHFGRSLLEQFPVQPNNASQVLSGCLQALVEHKPQLALAHHLLSSELPREKLLETPLEQLFDLTSYDAQSDAWFVYYFTQFSLYRPGESEFYETWEQILMAFLNKDNKISFLNGKTQNMVPELPSERFVPINPTRMLLNILEGKFTGTDQEYLVFLLALAKGLFHPEVADELVEIYISETEEAVEASTFDARMSSVLILQPSSLAREYLRDKVSQKIVSGQSDEYIVIAEYAAQLALSAHKSTLAAALWIFLAITEALLNQGQIKPAEEYIRSITAKRAASGLTDSDSFTREFKRVRQLYYDTLERKGSDSISASSFNLNGTNAIAQINQIGQQVFGMFKGVLSTSNKPSGNQATNAPEEVKWDPVSKRWLINGQIPDDEPEPEVKAPAPPPPKRLPPSTVKKQAEDQTEVPQQKKPSGPGGKPKFVAYDFGNHKK